MSAPDLPADFNLPGWLENIGLGEFVPLFTEIGITTEHLPNLTDEYLQSIGMDEGYREYLLEAVQKLLHTPVSVVREVAPEPEPVVHPEVKSVAAPIAPMAAEALETAIPEVKAVEVVQAVETPEPRRARSGKAYKDDRKKVSLWAKIAASKFLLVSIILHLLFAAGATYWVVQRVQANRKLTFQGGPPTSNPSQRAMEHQVTMAKKKSGGAPPQAKRIVSSGMAQISLPDMPSLPTTTTSVSSMMSGMGGAGFGQGTGFGNGMGSGMGGGGGGGMTMFGFHDASGGGLAGEFYDLKQTREKRPSGMDIRKYGQVVANFVKAGWPDSQLRDFYKAPKMLYSPQIMVPDIDAALAPKAFDAEREVQPKMWVALYKGKVVAPESGTFHFVGQGDDILFVKFNGKTVLNACWVAKGQLGGDATDKMLGIHTAGRYEYHWPQKVSVPFAKGEPMSVQAGNSYPIEILIGEWPGGGSHFILLMEKDGETYEKGIGGVPVLPAFRMANVKVQRRSGDSFPLYKSDGLIWRAEAPGAGAGSLLDALKQ